MFLHFHDCYLELSDDHRLRDDDDPVVLLIVQQVLDGSISLQDLHAAAVLVQVVNDSGNGSGVTVQVLRSAQTSANESYQVCLFWKLVMFSYFLINTQCNDASEEKKHTVQPVRKTW
jgi:hypothetical protein